MGETNSVAATVSAIDWAAELLELATRADAMERDPEALLADRLELATDAFSRLWLAWSPAVVARSCRASARLLEPLLVVAADLDEQLQSNQQIRMRALLSAAQLERPAEIAPVLPGPAPADVDVDELPAPAEPAQHPVAALEPTPPAPSRTLPPPGWWPAADVGELLGLNRSAVCRRRNAGALGEAGTGWLKCGKAYYYSPAAVEALEAGEPMQQLNALVSQIQAEQ